MQQTIIKSAWLSIENNQILCARSIDKKAFYIPGGKQEKKESPEEALVREIKEELGVDLLKNSIAYAGTFTAQADGHQEGIQVKMNCYYAEYEGTLIASSEIAEFAWLSHSQKDKCSYVDHIIFDWLLDQKLLH